MSSSDDTSSSANASGPSCNLCGGGTVVLLAGRPTIVRCKACRLISLAEFPSAEERETGYQASYYDEARGSRFLGPLEAGVRFFRWLRARSIVRHEPRPASILDVGCGRGLMLAFLRRRGWRVLGTQLSRTAARAMKERGDVDVFVGEIGDLPADPGSFRVVTFYHVLEHLDRPRAYLERACALLEDDGLLVVEVPDFSSIGFRWLGLRHLCIDYPNHLIFFTPATLRRLLEGCGFRVVETSRFSLEYSPFTTLQNFLNVLPGEPNRLYRALQSNEAGSRLRRDPRTWLHFALAAVLALPALLVSLASLFLPTGNTLRCVCRKVPLTQRSAAAREEEARD